MREQRELRAAAQETERVRQRGGGPEGANLKENCDARGHGGKNQLAGAGMAECPAAMEIRTGILLERRHANASVGPIGERDMGRSARQVEAVPT